MTWEEWDKAYPARKVEQEPEHYREKCERRYDAEAHRDYIESVDEVAAEVVEFQGFYYVIYKT